MLWEKGVTCIVFKRESVQSIRHRVEVMFV